MRYAVLVTGPAGAGKTTFSNSFITHLTASKRTAHLVNLDPAVNPASFEYEPAIDIKDLVTREKGRGASFASKASGTAPVINGDVSYYADT